MRTDEIEILLLNKLADVFTKEEPAVIEDDLADDFIYSSENFDFIMKKDFSSYMRNKLQRAKEAGITSKFEVVEAGKEIPKYVISKTCPKEPVDDIRILDFRTSSSKYRLVRRRNKEYEICDFCYQILLDDKNKILVMEEFSYEPREMYFKPETPRKRKTKK